MDKETLWESSMRPMKSTARRFCKLLSGGVILDACPITNGEVMDGVLLYVRTKSGKLIEFEAGAYDESGYRFYMYLSKVPDEILSTDE